MKSFLVSKTVEAEGLYDSDPFATGRIKMKKHKFIVLALVFMLLFAAVSCNQEPEIKADPLDETKQAIPAENVDMTNAQAITDDQKTAFTTDWNKALEQFSKGLIAHGLSNEGMSLGDVLSYYFEYNAPKTAGSDASDEDPFSVKIMSFSGTASAKATKVVVETTADANTTTDEPTPEPETIVINNVSATATLSKEKTVIVITGTINGKPFSISLQMKINEKNAMVLEEESIDPTLDDDTRAELDKILNAEYVDFREVQGLSIEMNGVELGMDFFVVGYTPEIPANVSIEGTASVDYSNGEISIKVDALKVSMEVEQLANLDATIKDLSIDIKGGLSIEAAEVSLSGTLLPRMDNIRFKATVKDAKFSLATGLIEIASIEVSAKGYEVVSIAANLERFSMNVTSEGSIPEFAFGAAVSIGNQTIGVRGSLSNSSSFADFDFISVSVLNGKPVTFKSLVNFIIDPSIV